MPLRKYWTTVRDSLWFIPALWVIASAILAFGMITIDRRTPEFAASFPLVFGGGAEGARGLLSSIAGSMITVAGVTFSITIVALQLASSQLSPRVLRNFMSDRSSQVVLGAFIGAFTYSILVLRSIRSEQDDIAAFVPSVAVSVGIGFSLVALGMFVYFIHHIASRIQLSSIVGKIADETTEQVRSEWTEADENAGPAGLPDEEPGQVTADGSGYLQLMDFGQLHEIATEHLIVIRVEVKLGSWVQEDAPLFAVWPASAARAGCATACCARCRSGRSARSSRTRRSAFGSSSTWVSRRSRPGSTTPPPPPTASCAWARSSSHPGGATIRDASSRTTTEPCGWWCLMTTGTTWCASPSISCASTERPAPTSSLRWHQPCRRSRRQSRPAPCCAPPAD